MRSGEGIPRVKPTTPLSEALLEISNKGLGMTTVTDEEGNLAGIFTDGDLRRTLKARVDINSTPMAELMRTGAKTVTPEMLAAEAMRIMEENEISSLINHHLNQLIIPFAQRQTKNRSHVRRPYTFEQ